MSSTLNITETVKSLAAGQQAVVEADDVELLLCNVGGEIFAIENQCSHQSNKLCGGRMTGYVINCPVHNAQFDVRDGTHKGPPAFRGIRVFPVTEENGELTIEVEAKRAPAPPKLGNPFGIP